jgi:hypothetical protein
VQEAFDSELAEVRRNRVLLAATCLPLALPPALFFAGAGASAFLFMFQATILSILLLAGTWNRNPRPRIERVRVRVHDGALRLGDRRVYPKGDLRDALLVPQPNARPPRVLVKKKGLGPRLTLEVGSVDEGRALMRALGFDASQSVAKFRLPSRMVARPGLFGAGIVTLWVSMVMGGMLTGSALCLVVLPVVLVALLSALIPSRVEVGADGLVLRWLWTRRFIPHMRIRRVDEFMTGKDFHHGVDLTLDSGERVRIPVHQVGSNDWRTAMVLERVREAMEIAKRGLHHVDASLLQQNGRDVKGWMTALRSIGTGANASLRIAPVPSERLWHVVEDPGAEVTARAGAAVALAADLDDDRRARLRVAAEAIASPKLRVVLEQVAEGTADLELESALDELGADAARARAR